MSHPRATAPTFRGHPPSHRGLGLLGYLVSAGLLVVAYVLLSASLVTEANLVPPGADSDAPASSVELVCLSPLSGGPSGLAKDDVELPQVAEDRVEGQDDVVATCGRLRDQAIARAAVVGTAGLLVAVAVTGLLGWAARRREQVSAE